MATKSVNHQRSLARGRCTARLPRPARSTREAGAVASAAPAPTCGALATLGVVDDRRARGAPHWRSGYWGSPRAEATERCVETQRPLSRRQRGGVLHVIPATPLLRPTLRSAGECRWSTDRPIASPAHFRAPLQAIPCQLTSCGRGPGPAAGTLGPERAQCAQSPARTVRLWKARICEHAERSHATRMCSRDGVRKLKDNPGQSRFQLPSRPHEPSSPHIRRTTVVCRRTSSFGWGGRPLAGSL